MKIINLVLILFLLGGCNKSNENPPTHPDFKEISFMFVLLDSIGNDLFFGDESIYDPFEVKLTVVDDTIYVDSIYQSEWFHIVDTSYFELLGPPHKSIESILFLFEFFPGNVDTIRILETPPPCNGVEIFQYDALFNDKIVCSCCSYLQIHKIVVE